MTYDRYWQSVCGSNQVFCQPLYFICTCHSHIARWQLLLLSFCLLVTVVYCQCTNVCISILWFTSACANSLRKWQLVNSHSADLKAQSICNSRTFKCPHKNLVLSSHSDNHHHLPVLRFLQYWSLLYKTTMTTQSLNMQRGNLLKQPKTHHEIQVQ